MNEWIHIHEKLDIEWVWDIQYAMDISKLGNTKCKENKKQN